MNSELLANAHRGTWRLRSPADTLQWITPRLPACGITRCADVTYLDPIGVPVSCAIRPTAAVLQVSNGKGMTHEAAQVSALMEAVEFHHAENPAEGALERLSMDELRARGEAWLEPQTLHGWYGQSHISARRRIEWATGTDLSDGTPVRVPASALYFHRTPSLHRTSTNGLASGNHAVEATLHGMLELIERDAAAQVHADKRVRIRGYCRIVDLTSIVSPDLGWLCERIAQSQSRLVLLQVPSRVPAVHVFWAVLMNEQSWVSGSTFNTGWGAHLDVQVAATRAVTEAIQSRATMVHGAREDAQSKAVFRNAREIWDSKAFRFFMDLEPDTQWSDLGSALPAEVLDLQACVSHLVAALKASGIPRVVRVDLSRDDIGVPVVRVVAPGLGLHLTGGGNVP